MVPLTPFHYNQKFPPHPSSHKRLNNFSFCLRIDRFIQNMAYCFTFIGLFLTYFQLFLILKDSGYFWHILYRRLKRKIWFCHQALRDLVVSNTLQPSLIYLLPCGHVLPQFSVFSSLVWLKSKFCSLRNLYVQLTSSVDFLLSKGVLF